MLNTAPFTKPDELINSGDAIYTWAHVPAMGYILTLFSVCLLVYMVYATYTIPGRLHKTKATGGSKAPEYAPAKSPEIVPGQL